MIKKILIAIQVLQIKKAITKIRPVKDWTGECDGTPVYYEVDRINPWNPITWILIFLGPLLLPYLIYFFFGKKGISEAALILYHVTISERNPFKWNYKKNGNI